MIIENPIRVQAKDILTKALLHKMSKYNPEPAVMPFHTRLLGKDRMALFSFIQSLNTNFGTSIFEPIAKCLATNNFVFCENQQIAGEYIYSEAQNTIQVIMNKLILAESSPNKTEEISKIRDVCQKGSKIKVKPTKVDLKLVDNKGKLFLMDIKTAKANAGGFKEFKRTMLEWVAVVLAENPNVEVDTIIAIPYNPYAPKPYSRWTMVGMIDLNYEVKVANEFWNFLYGDDIFDDLLKIFEEVGIELSNEIDDYFNRFL